MFRDGSGRVKADSIPYLFQIGRVWEVVRQVMGDRVKNYIRCG